MAMAVAGIAANTGAFKPTASRPQTVTRRIAATILIF
jgi:hypothetical protein